jgi:hypothetical protein
VEYRPNPQPLPYKGRGVRFKASLLKGERFGERSNCIASKREPLYDYIYSDLKGVPLSSYIIFYRVLEDGIEILRVISGRRDLFTVFQ